VPGAESAQEQRGCDFAGSCGRGLREVLPGKGLSLRQLVNSQFRLQPGAFTIRAHTAVVVHAQNLFDSPQIAQFDVTDTLTVKVQRGNENQLRAAFQPFVKELDSPDLMKRSEAAGAITVLAPPFLEDVLVALTKSSYAYVAIGALRKADTSKTREALAQIATGTGASMLRIEAARNLGRTHDATYLLTLFKLMETNDKEIQNAVAEAAGNLDGPAAVPQLAALVSSSDVETRRAGTNGLGDAHASQAVPILIGVLLDSDANVRQAAISGLYLLTHRAAFENNQWADVTSPQSAAAVHQRWVSWWHSHGKDSKIHGLADCAPPESLD
jgi:HEAT repeats